MYTVYTTIYVKYFGEIKIENLKIVYFDKWVRDIGHRVFFLKKLCITTKRK